MAGFMYRRRREMKVRRKWIMSHQRSIRVIVSFSVAALALGLTGAAAFQLEWRDAKDWIISLERETRLADIQAEKRISYLNLKPGDIVADIGAGTGVFSRAMAKEVAPTGKVYAEDVQQALVDFIDKRAKEEGIDNIVTIFGEFSDPKLPANDVDVAWFHDVFHAVEDKETMLKNLVSYMKPDSRIAITEYDPNDPAALRYHESLDILMSQQEARELFAKFGFYQLQEIQGWSLEGIKQWYIIFQRKQ